MVASSFKQSDHTQSRQTFFFYGTLCHPVILKRVLSRSSDDLFSQDALLPNHTRHHVKNEDYPALVPRDQTDRLLKLEQNLELSPDEYHCRGTLVSGITYEDMHALDVFEGTEYTRKRIPILPLTEPLPISQVNHAMLHLDERKGVDIYQARKAAREVREANQRSAQIALTHVDSGTSESEGDDGFGISTSADPSAEPETGTEVDKDLGVEAWVYVWSNPLYKLESKPWSYSTFLQDKAKLWTGLDTTEFDEVERHHAIQTLPGVDGAEPSVEELEGTVDTDADENRHQVWGTKMLGKPTFGRGMKKFFGLGEEVINLNNGSYGSPPLTVIQKKQELLQQCERDPNRFMKRSYLPLLTEAREKVAELIKAPLHEVVLVPNASSGVQGVLREIQWEEGDVVITYNTTYGAVNQGVKYICDKHPHLSMETIHLTTPLSHGHILDATRKVLSEINSVAVPDYSGRPRPSGRSVNRRVRMLVLDHIASVPGIVFPYAQLVSMCKEYGVLSLVDAAHAIGQVDVDVKAADPDFWISNCHKWLYTSRSCAVLYVPLRNQQLIRSTFPTGPAYESGRYPTDTRGEGGGKREWKWVEQYDWTGTIDWSSYLTIPTALSFREEIGGEERVMGYCRSLALRGGKRLGKKWGTRVIYGDEAELVAAMANVELPNVPDPQDVKEQGEQLTWFEDELLRGNAFAATYRFDGKWWARFSCQIWNDLEDFDILAAILEDAIEGIRQGRHRSEPVIQEVEMRVRPDDLPTQDG